MRAVEIIEKKRDGHELSADEIRFLIDGYVADRIPDYQVAAWAMAVFFQGMTPRETTTLTEAMIASGETLSFKGLGNIIDKHSTGGVGDKTTLVVAPLAAAAGLRIAKMSGRGLGHSGGTIDKLESIPGFRVALTRQAFLETVQACGIAVISQTHELVPADAKLYALRDVTGTVPSIPLIASSIMSKKIAGGAEKIVLDVKVGRGAFMETLPQARELASLMIEIGKGFDRKVTAVLADMNQPLGYAIGNSLEVIEAIETLRGNGPVDFQEHCLAIATEMLLLGFPELTPTSARERADTLLHSGAALDAFRRWITAQGGDAAIIDDPTRLPTAPVQQIVPAPQSGTIAALDARLCGTIAVALGAGREVKGAPIDHSVGIVLHAKIGDRVEKGTPLATIHARNPQQALEAGQRLLDAYTWTEAPVAPPPHIHEILRG